MADFEQAVELVLKHEGGYSAGLPNDPGGETNFGISKRAYPQLDIKNLTVEGAKEIYQRDYWHFGDFEDQQLANCALDCAVNQGLAFAVSRLTPIPTLKEFQIQRLMRYGKIIANHPVEASYMESWARRTLDV